MKKNKALLLTIILVVAFVFSSNLAIAQTSSADAVQAEEFELAAEVTNPDAIALLIRDTYPWGFPANEDALIILGIPYDVVNSWNLHAVDLNKYQFIMYASSQYNSSYYQNILNNMAMISAYVSNGGLLLAHACDQYFVTGGNWFGFSILPGDVRHVWLTSENINITDPTHCVVQGLDDAYFYGWYWSTHGYFTNLLPGTNVVMVTPSDLPTYIDYNYGRGKVMATLQTMEWGYRRSRPQFLLNELECALEWKINVFVDIKPGSCPNPLNVDSKGVLTVAILGTEDLDISTIDPATIRLTLEGDGGATPIRWAYEDVATPFEGELCDCHDLNGDVYMDLSLKFDRQELVGAIGKEELIEHEREMVPLILIGNLKDEFGGRPIEGIDCVFILSSQRKK